MAKKLNDSEHSGHIIYKGKLIRKNWHDASLYERYRNCTDFTNEVIRKFQPLKSVFDIDNNHIEKYDNFMQWLNNELKNPELRDCFNKSINKNIKEIKKLIK